MKSAISKISGSIAVILGLFLVVIGILLFTAIIVSAIASGYILGALVVAVPVVFGISVIVWSFTTDG